MSRLIHLILLCVVSAGSGLCLGWAVDAPPEMPRPAPTNPEWECECGPCSAFCSEPEKNPTCEESIVELLEEAGYYQWQWNQAEENYHYCLEGLYSIQPDEDSAKAHLKTLALQDLLDEAWEDLDIVDELQDGLLTRNRELYSIVTQMELANAAISARYGVTYYPTITDSVPGKWTDHGFWLNLWDGTTVYVYTVYW